MSRIFKRGKVWYIDYSEYGRRIVKRVGRSKEVAKSALSEIERRTSRINARKLIHSFYENGSDACQICGYPFTLEKHHFIPRSQDGSDSPANKVKLCPNHHRLLHLALRVLNGNKRKNVKELKKQLEHAF